MKRILNTFKNSELIKVSSKNSLQVTISFIVGLIKIKIASVWLGPSGLALLSQFTNLTQLAANIASGGISNGVTKLAKHGHSKKQLGVIISSSLTITIISSALVAIAIFLSAHYLSLNLLYDASFKPLVQISGIFIFFQAITNLTLSLLKGLKNHKRFILTNIFITLTSIALQLPAIYLWGIKGAFWAMFVTFFISGLYSVRFLKIGWKKPVFSKIIGKRLLGFSTMFIVASLIAPLTQIVVRNIIIEHCSLLEAGWWDGVKRISSNYLSLLTAAISLYILPKVAELTKIGEIEKEIKEYLVTIVPIVSVGAFTIYICRHLIINILFTEDFSGMESLFFYQGIGDVFKIMGWFLSIILIMQEKVKTYILSEVLTGIIVVGSAYFIIPEIGITGSTLSYLVSNVMYCILTLILFRISFSKN